jgi:hypothetical protein
VTYVEAARALAQRVLQESIGASSDERIVLAFRHVTGRRPRGEELRVLAAGLAKQLAKFRADPAAAEKLLAFGESKRDPALDPVELAAYTTVAGVILNLDETITQE